MNDFTITVKYTHTPPYYGYRNSLLVPEEPSEPEDISIYEVTGEDGKQIDLSEISLIRIEEHILKHVKEWCNDTQ